MARNTGDDHRIGSVEERSQVHNPVTGRWTKRDREEGSGRAGQFLNVKSDGEPFKGVATEPDGRRGTEE